MASQHPEILRRVQQRAAELVKVAADNFKIRLDYSDASIPRVEQALNELHEVLGGKVEKNKGSIAELSTNFGSYIGEVLRRKHGGEWRDNLPNFPPRIECLDVNGAIVSPMQQVFLRVTKGAQYNIAEFYKKVETAIASQRASRQAAGATNATDAGAETRKKAAEAVADAKQLFGIELDYTEATLDRLDEALRRLHNVLYDKVPASERMNDDEKFLMKPVAAWRYVAYLGEVCSRLLGAEWKKNIPGCRPDYLGLVAGGKLLSVELKGSRLEPREIIVNCINDPDRWSAKNYYFDAKRTLQADAGMANAKSFDDKMAVIAQEAVTIARDRHRITLDFSENSVKELENLLAQIHTRLPKPDDPQRPSNEWITSIAVTFGAYFGEIIRKNLGGHWLPQNPHLITVHSDGRTTEGPGSLPVLNVQGNILTPCRKVLKRILEGPGDNVAYFYKVSSDLIRNGGVPPDSWLENSSKL